MKILITGNMGYVGPLLLEQLRKTHPEAFLAGIDTGYFAHCLTGVTTFPEDRLDVQYFADLRKPPQDLFKDVDAVVHLAAISNDPMGDRFNLKKSVNPAESAKPA